MTIPTEPIGSLPRPAELVAAFERMAATAAELEPLDDAFVKGTALAAEELGAA